MTGRIYESHVVKEKKKCIFDITELTKNSTQLLTKIKTIDINNAQH